MAVDYSIMKDDQIAIINDYCENDMRKLKLNKIAARWPAKAVAQFFTFF